MPSVAVFEPLEVGANVTVTVVVAPGASVTLLALLKLSLNSAAFVPVIVVASTIEVGRAQIRQLDAQARVLPDGNVAKRERASAPAPNVGA